MPGFSFITVSFASYFFFFVQKSLIRLPELNETYRRRWLGDHCTLIRHVKPENANEGCSFNLYRVNQGCSLWMLWRKGWICLFLSLNANVSVTQAHIYNPSEIFYAEDSRSFTGFHAESPLVAIVSERTVYTKQIFSGWTGNSFFVAGFFACGHTVNPAADA